MADSKISALTPVDALAGDELIYVVQGGGDASATPDDIKDYIGALPATGGTLNGYFETGATLPFVADGDGDIEIPLDGKVYALTITGDCNLTHGAIPTSPAVGSALVYIEIDTADDPVITLDAAWHWPDAAVTDIPNGDNERCELLLNVSPQGWVIARVVSLGVPA